MKKDVFWTWKKSILGSLFAVLFMFGMSFVNVSAQTVLTRQLDLGMSGSDVSLLQTFLAKDSTIYPQGLVTGYFGQLTRTAVMNFQTRFGIPAVGRVGPLTLTTLNSQMSVDVVAPTIYGVNISTTSNSATFNWNTNENASAIVYYGTSFPYMLDSSATTGVTIGGSSLLAHTNLQTGHSATISGLSSNTTYYYVLYVKDGNGNESLTWPNTFKTSY